MPTTLLLRLTGIGTLLMAFIMKWTGAALQPYSIVQLEFARTTERADSILAAWGHAGQSAARLNTYLDFVFILCYASFGYLAMQALLAKESLPGLRLPGKYLSYGMLLAGLLDVVENICMLQTLAGNESEIFPQAAFWLAAVKFGLIGLSGLFAVGMLLRKLVVR